MDLYVPGDRVIVEGRPGTYYSRSASGELHTIKLDEPFEQGSFLGRRTSSFVFFWDGPAIEQTIIPVSE